MKGNLFLLKDSSVPWKINLQILQCQKNVYIDKLDDIINNTYHSTIKMKPLDIKPSTHIGSSKEINYQDLNLKLVILLEYQDIRTYSQKAMF